MSNEIYLVGRGKVNDGKVGAAKANLAAVIEKVRTGNPGVELYEHAIDVDTGAWTGIEKYADNEALKAHLTDADIGAALGAFMVDLTFEGIVVVGDVDPANKELMANFQPTYLGASLGFSRATLTA